MISADPRITKLFALINEGYSSCLAAKMSGLSQREFALIRKTPAFKEVSKRKDQKRFYNKLHVKPCSLEEYMNQAKRNKIPKNSPL